MHRLLYYVSHVINFELFGQYKQLVHLRITADSQMFSPSHLKSVSSLHSAFNCWTA